MWDRGFLRAYRKPAKHAWSLLEYAAPDRSSQCGTRGNPPFPTESWQNVATHGSVLAPTVKVLPSTSLLNSAGTTLPRRGSVLTPTARMMLSVGVTTLIFIARAHGRAANDTPFAVQFLADVNVAFHITQERSDVLAGRLTETPLPRDGLRQQ